MYAPKDGAFVWLKRCFPVESILIPVMLIIGKCMNCLNKNKFNYAWMLLSLEINFANSHSKCVIILWISITLRFYLKLYPKRSQSQWEIGLDVYLSIRNEYSLAFITSEKRFSFSLWDEANSAVFFNAQVLKARSKVLGKVTMIHMGNWGKELFPGLFNEAKAFCIWGYYLCYLKSWSQIFTFPIAHHICPQWMSSVYLVYLEKQQSVIYVAPEHSHNNEL